eukprot:2624213-Pyramimonas_sp.AAC.1
MSPRAPCMRAISISTQPWRTTTSLPDGEQKVYATLEGPGLHDDELSQAFATMQEERRKTWKQNRDLKRKMKVDLESFDRSKDKPEPAHRQQRGHRAANGQVRPRKSRRP